MNISEAIENWKKDFLSPFCLHECNGLCCGDRGVKLRVTKNHIDEMFKTNNDPALKITARHDWDNPGHFFMNLYQSDCQPHCPAYCPQTKLCRIEHSRPEMCQQFPIIIKKNEEEIIIHHRCLLTKKPGPVLEKLKQICLEFNYSLYIE